MIRCILFFLFPCVVMSCGNKSAHSLRVEAASIPESDSIFPPLSDKQIRKYHDEVEDYYQKNLVRTGFNGAILVAKDGHIVFEDYRGFANFQTKDLVDEHTPFHLASISKTFTGMTILRLWEEGRINLEDTIQHFFPGLPYHGVTVKTLLNHRSGLPNYLYFMDSIWDKKQKATNYDVVNFMMQHKPAAYASPDRVYHYCNTNYVLLALIIEKITQQPFPQYMKDSVFTPLGLKDTYVFSIADTSNYVPTYSVSRPFLMDHLDCTYGDKNVYSTVRDLYQWDKVLYENTFIKSSTLQMAITPYSNEKRSMHNYGLAWHLFFNNGDTIVYHNGKWHGSNTVFTRFIQDTATVIVLGNKENRNIYKAKEIGNIFTGKTDTTSLEE